MATVIAIANQKGGVRKTTTTSTLGYLLAQEHQKNTLLLDVDPQKNLTNKFLQDYAEIQKENSLYSVFKNEKSLFEIMRSTPTTKLYICPSHLSMATIENEIISQIDGRTRLKSAIEDIQDKFDYIIIDCPPNLGLYSISGLAAADYVIIPLSHLGDETEGLKDLLDTIKSVKKHLNSKLQILGMLITMSDSTNLSKDFGLELRSKYGDLVFDGSIPRNIKASEAVNAKQIIFEYSTPKSTKENVEQSYRKFTQQVINKVKILNSQDVK